MKRCADYTGGQYIIVYFCMLEIFCEIEWDKSRLTVVRMENKTIINNNVRINCVCVFTTVSLRLPHPVFSFTYTATQNKKCFLKYKKH